MGFWLWCCIILFLISRRTGLINASRRISIFRGLRKAEPQNRIISYTTSGGRISVVNHVECNELGAIPASTLVICAVPDFVTWAVGHLSAVSMIRTSYVKQVAISVAKK